MSEIDWEFIAKEEGGGATTCYVICNLRNFTGSEDYDQKKYGTPKGGGVTIATGFDIGRHDEFELKRLGLSKELREKLMPFLALGKGRWLEKEEAIKKLREKKGLTILQEEAATIDVVVKKNKADILKKKYNLKVAAKKKTLLFEQLPAEIQTALASFAYNVGPNVDNPQEPAKSIWEAATNEDFETVAKILEKQTFLASRRRKEAALVRKGMPNLPVTSPVETSLP